MLKYIRGCFENKNERRQRLQQSWRDKRAREWLRVSVAWSLGRGQSIRADIGARYLKRYGLQHDTALQLSQQELFIAQPIVQNDIAKCNDYRTLELRRLHLSIFILLPKTLLLQERIYFCWTVDLGFRLLCCRIQSQGSEFH